MADEPMPSPRQNARLCQIVAGGAAAVLVGAPSEASMRIQVCADGVTGVT